MQLMNETLESRRDLPKHHEVGDISLWDLFHAQCRSNCRFIYPSHECLSDPGQVKREQDSVDFCREARG